MFRIEDDVIYITRGDNADLEVKVYIDEEQQTEYELQEGDTITFTVRIWAKTTDYWNLYFSTMEKVKEEFDKQNIQIPYNQLDVTIRGNENE